MPPPHLTPSTSIPNLPSTTIADFWSWAYSDVLSNATRGVFAEFIVGKALGVVDGARLEWDAVDLRHRGRGIEVKSAAYLQTWEQLGKLSAIKFGIAKTRGWDAKTNTSSTEPCREADAYVFCLYPEKDAARANVLDVAAWKFYVLPTATIEREFGEQKTVALGPIQRLVVPVGYHLLKAVVDKVVGLE